MSDQSGFETVFRDSMDGLAILKNDIFVDCNQSMLNIVGATRPEQFVGQTPAEFSPPFQPDGMSSAEKAEIMISQCIELGCTRFEWVHIKVDGTEFWADVLLTKMTLDGEDVIHTSWRDISEKKLLELETHKQKLTFETLFNDSLDGLCLLTKEAYIDCNPAFVELFGFKEKSEVIGITPIDISPEYQPDGQTSLNKATAIIQTAFSEGKIRFEWMHQKLDGTEFWCEIVLFKITVEDQEVLYASTRDISEKKELEIALQRSFDEVKTSNHELEDMLGNLQQTQEKLVESEKMASLGSLVAGVAHEINTPVGIALTGTTQLMEESRDIAQRYEEGAITEDDFEEFLSMANELSELVKKNLQRTAQLVKSFKQVAVDQTSEEDREINFKVYCEEVISSLASVVRKGQAEVSLDCPDDIQIMTNPGLLAQVLTNLIVNSINHGFSEGTGSSIYLQIREHEEGEISILYKDDGKGISKENLQKIFDPFFTTNRGKGGTGLGLNITYNIITSALGGSIKCTSVEGEGVEFAIKFRAKNTAC